MMVADGTEPAGLTAPYARLREVAPADGEAETDCAVELRDSVAALAEQVRRLREKPVPPPGAPALPSGTEAAAGAAPYDPTPGGSLAAHHAFTSGVDSEGPMTGSGAARAGGPPGASTWPGSVPHDAAPSVPSGPNPPPGGGSSVPFSSAAAELARGQAQSLHHHLALRRSHSGHDSEWARRFWGDVAAEENRCGLTPPARTALEAAGYSGSRSTGAPWPPLDSSLTELEASGGPPHGNGGGLVDGHAPTGGRPREEVA